MEKKNQVTLTGLQIQVIFSDMFKWKKIRENQQNEEYFSYSVNMKPHYSFVSKILERHFESKILNGD